MKISRVFLAAALQIVIVAVLTTNIVPIFMTVLEVPNRGAVPEGLPEAIRTTIVPTSRILIEVIAAFIAGWWGASGLTQRWIQQGLVIGMLVALFGVVLAAVGDGVDAGTTVVLLNVVGALAGAAVASLPIRIRRAFIAAGTQVIAMTILSVTLSLVALAWLSKVRGQLGDAEVANYQTYAPWVGLVLRMTTAFLAGWWGARGFRDDAVRQGLLIGVLILAFTYLLVIVLGREIELLSVPLDSLSIVAATAGAAFAQSRNRTQPA